MWGGCQDPLIKIKDGVIYIRFNARRDCAETMGLEDKNPVYCSNDGGITWEKSTHEAWLLAEKSLSNCDRLIMREFPIVYLNGRAVPEIPENRFKTKSSPQSSVPIGTTYTVDELYPVFGDEIAKEFMVERVKHGETESTIEFSKINWENMPIQLENDYLLRTLPVCGFKEDKNGTLWLTCFAGSVAGDGTMNSKKLCTHLLRSDDFGHSWDYVSTVYYKDEYNDPKCENYLEGFDEAALEILDNGDIIVIMRSGSLFPHIYNFKETDYPIPKIYIARSKDQGKTWCSVEPFYDYGIRPHSVKLDCGTIIMISGRPGVYVRATHDTNAEIWEDIQEIVHVPDNEVYSGYQNYSCCNSDICAFNENTAFITYSDFTLTAPNGEKAKSIMVRKLTVEEV